MAVGVRLGVNGHVAEAFMLGDGAEQGDRVIQRGEGGEVKAKAALDHNDDNGGAGHVDGFSLKASFLFVPWKVANTSAECCDVGPDDRGAVGHHRQCLPALARRARFECGASRSEDGSARRPMVICSASSADKRMV